MLCIDLDSENPYLNLAVEEILLKKSQEEYLILYINKPSVIIGKHQIAPKEVNLEFVTRNNIPVIRRISGGGTVFHDEGNLNFTFIRNTEEGKQVDFPKYTAPAINFLQSLGIDARFEGKNDIRVGGLKVSGNAEHIHRNRVLHHGTLLFGSSLEMLKNSIKNDTSCYSSRGVDSVRSSVINLKDLIKNHKDVSGFRSDLMNYFMETFKGSEKYSLSKNESEEAGLLATSKYMTWEWNWAYGPEYQFINRFMLAGEMIACRLFIRDGIIRECDIDGSLKIKNASVKFSGCRHLPGEMMNVLAAENVVVTENEMFNFF